MISDLLEDKNNADSRHDLRSLRELSKSTRLNVVALGKTGNGKSSVLNAILSASDPKQPLFDANGLPEGVKHISCSVHGIDVLLLDTRGFHEIEVPPPPIIAYQFTQLIRNCPKGIHIFLIVISSTQPFTDETRTELRTIMRHFGYNMVDHVIFVITGADKVAVDALDATRQKIKQYVRQQNILRDIGNERFVYFDNVKCPDTQVVELLVAIDKNLKQFPDPYCPMPFLLAQELDEEEFDVLMSQSSASETTPVGESTKNSPQQLVASSIAVPRKSRSSLPYAHLPKLHEHEEDLE